MKKHGTCWTGTGDKHSVTQKTQESRKVTLSLPVPASPDRGFIHKKEKYTNE